MSDPTGTTHANDVMSDDQTGRDPETLIRADRLREVRQAYEVIGRQIALLRTLDLEDTHPSVIFRPVLRRELTDDAG
ncbi:hypothetical protein [Jiella mangrovi]|uniref:Uncharacterized protein n=1 Tax=Jiella mangrovi TaxID=2821407 RepID=A0ABS4BME0_9HYPH|nr:hypothetical protein [Jiella mangrovi]MBP0617898.1 hypothetical protein [Jiella mangrovi]